MRNLLLCIIIGMFFVSCASATFSLSDYKQYTQTPESKYDAITLWNGNLIFPDENLGTVTLLNNTDSCGGDIECSAIIRLQLNKDWTNPFNKLETTARDKVTPFAINKQILIQDGTITEERPIYGVVCEKKENPFEKGTISDICENQIIGYEKVEVPNYVEYKGQELTAGTYEFKITGQKSPNEVVEWIPTFLNSFRLDEWALWGPTALQITLGTSTIDSNLNNIGANYPVSFNLNTTDTTKTFTIQKIETYISEKGGNGAGLTKIGLWHLNSTCDGTFGDGYPIGENSTSVDISEVGDYNMTFANNITNVTAGNCYTLVYFTTNTGANYNRVGEVAGCSGQSCKWDRAMTSGNPATLQIQTGGPSMVNIKVYGAEEIATSFSMNVTLDVPKDFYNTTANSLSFNSTVKIDVGSVTNATLWFNDTGMFNYTALTPATNYSNLSRTFASDGRYLWNVYYCADNATNSLCDFAQTNRTITIDSTGPTVNITYPMNFQNLTTFSSVLNVTLNFTASDSGVGLSSCWFNNGTGNTFITCGQNGSINLTAGNYNVTFYANDSLNNVGSVSRNFSVNYIVPKVGYTTVIMEGENNTFYFNITATTISKSNATLDYNNTFYAMTNTLSNATDSRFVVTIPNGLSPGEVNNLFNITYGINEFTLNTTIYTQSVKTMKFGLCNATLTVPFLNISFKNETTLQPFITASIVSTFTYYSASTSVSRALSYSSPSEAASFLFCFDPPDRSINATAVIYYLNSYSQQRDWTFNTPISFSNNTYNKTLFLLPNSAGQFVTFQIVNPSLAPIPSATVSINSTTFGFISSKLTDAAGGATFFLNPNNPYEILVEKTGYTSLSLTLTPTQTSYTLTLGQTTASNLTDITKGISYTVLPLDGTTLNNNTNYNFNFTISSTFWNLDNWGYNLTNGTAQIDYQSSTVGSGGILNSLINTGANSRIVMNYFWTVNGTTNNATREWIVMDLANNSQWSLLYMFNDIVTYMSGGIFGLTPFAFALIIYLTIFVCVGIMSYKFGFTSTGSVLLTLFVLVAIFDVGLGLDSIMNPMGIQYAPTILILIITAGIFIKEMVE